MDASEVAWERKLACDASLRIACADHRLPQLVMALADNRMRSGRLPDVNVMDPVDNRQRDVKPTGNVMRRAAKSQLPCTNNAKQSKHLSKMCDGGCSLLAACLLASCMSLASLRHACILRHSWLPACMLAFCLL